MICQICLLSSILLVYLQMLESLQIIGEPIRKVPKLGKLVGLSLVTSRGVKAEVFYGIPYAEPPIGDLRFRSPVAKKARLGSRKNPFRCQNYRPACPQNRTQSPELVQSEDCLYLNIFQSSACLPQSPCPVIYYIHGGGNEYDSPRDFPVEFLLDNFASRGVVLVTVGYRLGALGFWSTESPEAPGNNAVKDVILGLKWTGAHIPSFGGLSSEITIMGHSSGAMMVTILTLSPEAKGLFQGAISMSGAQVSLSTNPRYELLARTVGCNSNDEWKQKQFQDIVACMRSVPAEVLAHAYLYPDPVDAKKFLKNTSDDPPTTAVIDGPGGVLPDTIAKLKQSRAAIPYLLGVVSKEFATVTTSQPTLVDRCRQHSSPRFRNPEAVTAACADFYKKHGHSDTGWHSARLQQLAQKVHNDAYVFLPVFEEASSMHSKGAPVFLYEFQYQKDEDAAKTPFHAFDLYYVMGIHQDRYNWTEKDLRIRNLYMDLLTNFAKFGTPTPSSTNQANNLPTWDIFNSTTTCSSYYAINLPSPAMKSAFHTRGITFWKEVAPVVDQFYSDFRTQLHHDPLVLTRTQANSISLNVNAVLVATDNESTGNSSFYYSKPVVIIADGADTPFYERSWFPPACAVAILMLTVLLVLAIVLLCCRKRRRAASPRARRLRSFSSTASELSTMMHDAYEYRTFK